MRNFDLLARMAVVTCSAMVAMAATGSSSDLVVHQESDIAATTGVPDCLKCYDDSESEHTAPPGTDPDNERGGGSHTEGWFGLCEESVCVEWICIGGDCICSESVQAKHPACEVHFAMAERVEAAVTSGDVAARSAIMDRTDVVYLVSERIAIQVEGCDGSVLAHFKLPTRVLKTLAE